MDACEQARRLKVKLPSTPEIVARYGKREYDEYVDGMGEYTRGRAADGGQTWWTLRSPDRIQGVVADDFYAQLRRHQQWCSQRVHRAEVRADPDAHAAFKQTERERKRAAYQQKRAVKIAKLINAQR